jgi:hypothetical protein
MTAAHRALRTLRYVNQELVRAMEAIFRPAGAPRPGGQAGPDRQAGPQPHAPAATDRPVDRAA